MPQPDPRPAPGDTPRAAVEKLAGSQVVTCHPSFAVVAGNARAGLFLAQLFFWHEGASDPDGWVYKTEAEWEEQTGLSTCEQETARRRLRERGLLEEKLAGLPARLGYRLDVARLVELLSARVRRTTPPQSGAGDQTRDD